MIVIRLDQEPSRKLADAATPKEPDVCVVATSGNYCPLHVFQVSIITLDN